jgi:hypothetical protein
VAPLKKFNFLTTSGQLRPIICYNKSNNFL